MAGNVNQTENRGSGWSRKMRRRVAAMAAAALATGGLTGPVEAVPFYLDRNGATAGSAAGTSNWDTSTAVWTTDSTGSIASVPWSGTIDVDQAVFSAGTNGGNNTLNITAVNPGSTVDPDGILVEEGNQTISGGTIVLGGDIIQINTGTTVINSQVSGSGGINKTGAGTLVLASSANNYTGTTTVSAGTLQLGNGGTTGVIDTASALSFVANTNFQINQTDTVTQGIDFSGAAFTGNVNLIKAGTGNLVLTGNNTVRELRVNNATGFVDIGSGNLFVNNGGGNTISSTTGGMITGTGTITLGTGGGTNFGDNSANSGTLLTINPRITGANGFEYCCAAGGTIFLANNANDFLGPVFINSGGTLRVSTINNSGVASGLGLGSQINLNINGANLEYVGLGESTNRNINIGNAFSTFITQSGAAGNLLFNGPFTGGSGNKTLTLQGSTAGTGEISSIIGNGSSGTLGIGKSGTGTWTLSGANTYSGITSVNDGVLLVTNNASLGSSVGLTDVKGSGALHLLGGVDIGNENIRLGTNPSAAGLVSVSGNNRVGGTVSQLDPSGTVIGIRSDADKLTLDGPIFLGTGGVHFSGSGNTIVNGAISGDVGPQTINTFRERLYDLPQANNDIRGLSGGTVQTIINAPADVNKLFSSHINFANDAAINTEAGFDINGAGSNFAAVWLTQFTPNESGAWLFRNNGNIDDNAGYWLDLSQDGVFQTTERFAERACCGTLTGTTPAVVAGQTYALAFAMNDTGGGGSFIDLEFARPSAPAAFTDVNPSLVGNNGLFTLTFVPNTTLSKTGAGTLTLNNSAAFAQGVSVTGGALIVNDTLTTSNAVIGSGAMLGGLGTVDGSVLLQDGSIVSPGTSPGTLTTGSLTVGTTSGGTVTYLFDPNDLVMVVGDLTFVGNVAIVANVPLKEDGLFPLFMYSGQLNGFNPNNFTLAGISTKGYALNYRVIHDQANNKILLQTFVPEPSTIALAGLAGLSLLRRSRRRAD